MSYRKDFDKLLADEKFQNAIIDFDSFDREEKEAFIKQFSLTKDEFVKARTILNGLNFKGIDFSDEELNYFWEKLGIEESKITLRPKPQHRKIIRWVSKVAAILFIPLLITSIWLFDKTNELQSFKNDEVDRLTGIYNTVSAPVGGRTKAVLPDGSEIWLNSGSSIQYPILNKPSCREVKLTGEGFFKVAKDKDKPMLVTTSGMQVKVYGTTFNINAYEDNRDIETVLIEGSISIQKLDGQGNPKDVEYKMAPGEAGKLNRQKNTIAIAKTNNLEIYTGWVNGRYVFKNAQLKNILKRLEKIHNVQFVLEDETIGEYYFDATFEDQNIDRIMEIFSVSLPIKWRSVHAKQNDDQTFSTRKIIISKDKTRKLL
jgi:ferric-dicitrate binding protein FerR (iron transport regulator)